MKKEKLIYAVKKVFDRTAYIIEYIISFFLIKEIFRIVTTKAYNGNYPLSSIIYTIIFGIALIAIMIYICIKNKKIVEKMFLTFAIPMSIAFAIFVLPLHVPDEGSHLLRAYDVSVGNLFTQIDEKRKFLFYINSRITKFFLCKIYKL